jgi:hypothetical protein
MRRPGSKIIAAIMAASIFCQPAQACWDNLAVQAASIRHLDAMLMVTALRCRTGRDNFLSEYNAFITANNTVLGSQNAQLKLHFVKTVGSKSAENAADHFTIQISNRYGAGNSNMNCHQLKALAGQLASRSHEVFELAAVADKMVGMPELVGGRCHAQIASRQ